MNDLVQRPDSVHPCTVGELVPGDVLLTGPGHRFAVIDSAPGDEENVQLTLRALHGGPDFPSWRRRCEPVLVLMRRVDPAGIPLIHPTPPGTDFADGDLVSVLYATRDTPDSERYERRAGVWRGADGRVLDDAGMRRLMAGDPRTVVCRLERPVGARPRRRVVVTGVGAISPLGGDAASTWAGLLAGASGARKLGGEEFRDLPVKVAAPAAVEPGEQLPRAQARTMNRSTQFAVLTARQAWADAGLDAGGAEAGRTGVSVGTIIGGAPLMVTGDRTLQDKGARYVSPHTAPMLVPSASAAHIAIDLGARGEARTVVSACASGTEAIGQAIDRIRDGHVDVVVAGGTEAVITPVIMAGFASMRALSPGADGPENASRPFDRDRDGFVLGEGAGFLVLEDEEHALARGARIYCEAAGWGVSSDAHHMTAPDPAGTGITEALRKALDSAGAEPGDVIHVNAHATATPAGDLAEAAALRTVFGEEAAGTIPVTAPKGALGHLQGAAGGVEAVATVLALHHGVVPPTVGLREPAEGLGLDVVTGAPRALGEGGGVALSNSFGFGGHNAVVAFRREAA
ncbi:beta-ketoacyl-[acyl-carrier-protein] synthase family protein [Streptomyces sp. NPDC051940]|uniref:beta-ketoacyl-[acyl-carrier-protein] synthase family protein n=1 Tax=Streptomyces sp. NPDC051940 TaxID=3155675 RepID=UPI00341D2A52